MATNEESEEQAYRYTALANSCFLLAYWNSAIEYLKKAKLIFRTFNIKAKRGVARENMLMNLKKYEIELETYLPYKYQD